MTVSDVTVPLEIVEASAGALSEGLVDRRIYSDPGVYRLEQERVFARSWLVVAHESQIPGPGDFLESYMGEESVIVCRNREGEVRVLLNTCRHRGNKVCRAEVGTSRTFMCQYHGWTYDLDGRLAGAPLFKEVYRGDLDTDKWGLASARVATYDGLIFATFNPDAPSLEEHLGDFAWLLDTMLNPRPGGVEVASGFIRWTINMNWKFGAENAAGDLYHGGTTHRSARDIGHRAIYSGGSNSHNRRTVTTDVVPGYTMVSPQGHGVNWSVGDADKFYRDESEHRTPLERYYAEHVSEAIDQIGEYRALHLGRFNANIFPNAGFHSSAQTIHLLHPKGPEKTEIWLIPLIDKKAPPDVKAWVRRQADHHFGPGGFFEEDDGENWEQATRSCHGPIASRLPFNLQMGIGRESYVQIPDGPQAIEGMYNEYGQRSLLTRWHELMLNP